MARSTVQDFLHSVLLYSFPLYVFQEVLFPPPVVFPLLLKILSPILFTDPPTKTAKILSSTLFKIFRQKTGPHNRPFSQETQYVHITPEMP